MASDAKCTSCTTSTTTLAPEIANITVESTKQRPADELFIYEAGSGDEPVILLHDLASTHQYWFLLLPHLNQHKFKYLVPDLLGHGRSPKSSYLTYDMDTHVKYIYRDILEGWAITPSGPVKRVKNPVHIIGHGMGALIALELGTRFPSIVNLITRERTDSLVMFVTRTNYFATYRLLSSDTFLGFAYIPFIPFFTAKPTWLVRDCMKYTTTVTYSSYKNIILGHKIDESAKFLSTIGAYNVTLIHGKKNMHLPVECSQRFFQKYPELCQLDIFQEAGHNLPLYQAKDLAHQLNKEILS